MIGDNDIEDLQDILEVVDETLLQLLLVDEIDVVVRGLDIGHIQADDGSVSDTR